MIVISTASAASDGFLEDKEFAGLQRDEVLKPALLRGDRIVIDFGGVADASQSFVHALIAEALREAGIRGLDLLEFRNASEPVRDAIQLVIRYTFAEPDERLPRSGT